MNRLACITIFATALGIAGSARPQGLAWPALATPPGAQVQMVGSDMVLNGKVCRVLRFQQRAAERDVLAFYRGQFGARRVENRVKNDWVIATRQADYFHTVQLHALDAQTIQGTVMSTWLGGTRSSPASADTAAMLPVSTAVVSTLQSEDAGKRSLLVVSINKNSAQANRDHLVAALQDRGLRLVNENTEPAGATSFSLAFTAAAEDVSVTISDAGLYRTVIIHRTRESK